MLVVAIYYACLATSEKTSLAVEIFGKVFMFCRADMIALLYIQEYTIIKVYAVSSVELQAL